MSPKKKKKKGKKSSDILARMTVDQRRQYLERRAAQEQEKIRRREDLLAAFIKVKVDDEQSKCAINESKLNVKWRSLLRRVKCEELTKELQELKGNIDDDLRNHDETIRAYAEALQLSRIQREDAANTHLKLVQHMSEVHQEYISLLRDNFKQNQISLTSATEDDFETLTNEHLIALSQIDELKTLSLEKTNNLEVELMTKCQNLYARIKTKLEEEKQQAEEDQKEVEKSWMELANCLSESENDLSGLRAENNQLQEKVRNNMGAKEKLDQQIREMQEEMSVWKMQSESENSNFMSIEDEKNTEETIQELRRKTAEERIIFRKKIKEYNNIMKPVFEKLDKTAEMGEEILQLSKECRVLENENDKIIPYIPKFSAVSDDFKSFKEMEEVKKIDKESGIGSTITEKSTISTFEKNKKDYDTDSGVSTLEKSTHEQTVKYRQTYEQNSEKSNNSENENTKLKEEKHDRIIKYIEEDTTLKKMPLKIKSLKIVPEDGVLDFELNASFDKKHFSKTPISDFVMREAEEVERIHEDMSPLWLKINHAKLQKSQLSKEFSQIEKSNDELKKKLKNYFSSQGFSDDSLSQNEAPLNIKGLKLLN